MKSFFKMLQYEIVYDLNSYHRNELFELYKNEWWTSDRTKEDVDKFLKNSTFYIAFIEKSSQKLIGFCRVLTDTIKFAYIYDVIAIREYRKQGLGRELITETLSHPLMAEVEIIELVCHKDMCNFYHKFNFSEDYQGDRVAMRRYINK